MTDAAGVSPGRRLWRWLTQPPDEMLADAARDGEALVARLRIFITLLLTLSPIAALLIDVPSPPVWIGLGMALGAVAVALLLASVLQRTPYSAQISVVSAVIDVSLVSIGLAIFLVVRRPIIAANSRVIFECYFLAIGASALRYDPRATVLAGFAAIAEFLGISYLASRVQDTGISAQDIGSYGSYSWASQVSRVIVLLGMTFVSLEVVRRAQRLRQLSINDRLTGLFNRAYGEEYLANEVLRTARTRSSLVVGMIDVDHFKEFNDTYGHAAGDATLRRVAQSLRSNLRRSDVIARFGGDEFLVVLPATDLGRGIEKFEEIRVDVGLHEVRLPRGVTSKLTLSIGVAAWGADGMSVDALLDVADARLYAAKRGGRNRVSAVELMQSP